MRADKGLHASQQAMHVGGVAGSACSLLVCRTWQGRRRDDWALLLLGHTWPLTHVDARGLARSLGCLGPQPCPRRAVPLLPVAIRLPAQQSPYYIRDCAVHVVTILGHRANGVAGIAR